MCFTDTKFIYFLFFNLQHTFEKTTNMLIVVKSSDFKF